MPFLLPRIILSLLAGALAIMGLNLAFPAEIARAVTGVPFAALLANLPGATGMTRGLPVLTICKLEWVIARHVVRGVIARGADLTHALGDRMTGSRARAALAFNAVAAALSLPSLVRLLKWTVGAS